MRWLIEIENLEKLETEEKWEKIRLMLYEKWTNDKDNLGLLMRLATQCWYVCSEWGCLFYNIGLKYEDFKNNLIETADFGFKHFNDNCIFLCLFGLMITLSPDLFYKERDPFDKKYSDALYIEWENKGIEMQKQAYLICPEDPVIKIFYFLAINNTRAYTKAKKELPENALQIFPGKSELEVYFKHILTYKDYSVAETEAQDCGFKCLIKKLFFRRKNIDNF